MSVSAVELSPIASAGDLGLSHGSLGGRLFRALATVEDLRKQRDADRISIRHLQRQLAFEKERVAAFKDKAAQAERLQRQMETMRVSLGECSWVPAPWPCPVPLPLPLLCSPFSSEVLAADGRARGSHTSRAGRVSGLAEEAVRGACLSGCMQRPRWAGVPAGASTSMCLSVSAAGLVGQRSADGPTHGTRGYATDLLTADPR